jgi:hypothetical protein
MYFIPTVHIPALEPHRFPILSEGQIYHLQLVKERIAENALGAVPGILCETLAHAWAEQADRYPLIPPKGEPS